MSDRTSAIESLGSLKRWSESEREAVLSEVRRIVHHSSFKQSKRSVNLLRYLVEQTLDGNSDSVKERTLGVEVFGRNPDYDTSADTVVRTAANEIRKRLAQYYQDHTHPPTVRIDLIPGSYIPTFDFGTAEAPSALQPASALTVPLGPEAGTPRVGSDERRPREALTHPLIRWKWQAVAAALILAISVALYLRLGERESGFNRFWKPFFDSKESVFLCVGAINWRDWSREQAVNAGQLDTERLIEGKEEPPAPSSAAGPRPNVAWVDAGALSKLTAVLSAHQKKFTVRAAPDVALSDLRTGPVILVGMLNNPWTLRLTSGLRFHPRVNAASGLIWIEDAKHPERHDWSARWGQSYETSGDDYAIVSRFRDPMTGSMMTEIGGLSLHGTQSASEFITDPKYLNALYRNGSIHRENFQAVLKIQVINGEAGSPEVVALDEW